MSGKGKGGRTYQDAGKGYDSYPGKGLHHWGPPQYGDTDDTSYGGKGGRQEAHGKGWGTSYSSQGTYAKGKGPSSETSASSVNDAPYGNSWYPPRSSGSSFEYSGKGYSAKGKGTYYGRPGSGFLRPPEDHKVMRWLDEFIESDFWKPIPKDEPDFKKAVAKLLGTFGPITQMLMSGYDGNNKFYGTLMGYILCFSPEMMDSKLHLVMKAISAHLFPRREYRSQFDPNRPLQNNDVYLLDYLFDPECNEPLLNFIDTQVAWDPLFGGGSKFFAARATAKHNDAKELAEMQTRIAEKAAAQAAADELAKRAGENAMDTTGGAATDTESNNSTATAQEQQSIDALAKNNMELQAKLTALQTIQTASGKGSGGKEKQKTIQKRRKTSGAAITAMGSPASNLRSKNTTD